MASSKQIQIYVAVGLLVGAGALWWTQSKKNKANINTTTATSGPSVRVANTDEVDRIEIKAKEKLQVVLEKKPEGWAMSQPVQTTKLVKTAIDDVLNAMKTMTLEQQIDSGRSNDADYDLTPEKAIHVVASHGGTKLLDLWLGAQKSRGQLARNGGSDAVWTLKGASAASFDKGPKDFRDTKIWEFPKDQVTSVDVQDGKGSFTFTKLDAPAVPADAGAPEAGAPTDAGAKGDSSAPAAPTWSGTVDGKPIDGLAASKVDELLNAFDMSNALKAEDFGDGKTDIETGLASSDKTTLTFHLKDGSVQRITLGKTEGTRRYARKEGDPTVYLLAEGPSSWAEAGLDKFAPPPPAATGDGGVGDAASGDASPADAKK